VALAVSLGLPAVAAAQNSPIPRVSIEPGGVRVGFKAGEQGSGAKVGFWTPVYVEIKAGLSPISAFDGNVVIESTDIDQLQNTYSVPLPSLGAKETGTVIAYARLANQDGELIVSVRDHDGKEVARTRATRNTEAGKTGYAARAPASVLYLTAGTNSASMARALSKVRKDGQPGMQPGMQPGAFPPPGGPPIPPAGPPMPPGGIPPQDDQGDLGPLPEDPWQFFAHADTAAQLPTRWFGYDGVDAAFLHTSNKTFVEDLLADRTGTRKEALAEWVRRGGRLVISVASRQQLVNELLAKMQVIGCNLTGTVGRDEVELGPWLGEFRNTLVGVQPRNGPRAKVDLAKVEVEPNKGVEVLVSEGGAPVIVQASCGLGRVILVAFDLDTPPFTTWSGAQKFWTKLAAELHREGAGHEADDGNVMGFGGPGMMKGGGNPWGGDHQDLATRLSERLESFNEVPVISFGWVALFILIYILVVGPLDYFLLKKVVKRLELTWITFPTVVLVVSAVAYFTAYYLKGNELRINKIDVVDIVADLDSEKPEASGTQVYGTTMFTLFSPRIQSYTVGVEPVAAWGPDPDPKAPRTSTVVSWFGRPEDAFRGMTRASSPSLFRRVYEYAPDAAGLRGVPIQVWSTKSFQATWQGRLTEDKPLITSDLHHIDNEPPGQVALIGAITSQLPVELTDVTLFYQGKVYSLGKPHLSPGPNRPPKLGEGGEQFEQWFQNNLPPNFPMRGVNGRGGPNRGGQPASYLIKPLLFGEKGQGAANRNSSFRYLDQSWRVKPLPVAGKGQAWRDEVIVVGRVVSQEGPAETVGNDGVSPSRLWLGSLPGESRTALAGVLSQETYVRIFIPVVPSKK
jgi:hypothetical protein